MSGPPARGGLSRCIGRADPRLNLRGPGTWQVEGFIPASSRWTPTPLSRPEPGD